MREYLLHMQAAFCSIPRVQICDASIYILLRQHLVSMEMSIFLHPFDDSHGEWFEFSFG